MKTIGVIAVMEEELSALKSKMETRVVKSAVGTEFHIGGFMGKSIVAVRCGVGKVNAAVAAQALIDLFAVDCIINTGVAGGIFKDVKIGDIVISKDAVYHDFDCTGLGFQRGEIMRMETSRFSADMDMLSVAKEAVSALEMTKERGVFYERIASGDIFVSGKEKRREIWENTSAYCAEMEGAAIAHVCYLNKLPFVIIRSVSDNADSGADDDFNKFLNDASKVSLSLLEKMLELIVD